MTQSETDTLTTVQHKQIEIPDFVAGKVKIVSLGSINRNEAVNKEESERGSSELASSRFLPISRKRERNPRQMVNDCVVINT